MILFVWLFRKGLDMVVHTYIPRYIGGIGRRIVA
jgi:hypothetical protein